MLWLGITASNSVMRKTTRLASVTYNLTSSKLHRHKIIKNDDMGVNIRVPRLMRPCCGFFIHTFSCGQKFLFPQGSSTEEKKCFFSTFLGNWNWQYHLFLKNYYFKYLPPHPHPKSYPMTTWWQPGVWQWFLWFPRNKYFQADHTSFWKETRVNMIQDHICQMKEAVALHKTNDLIWNIITN